VAEIQGIYGPFVFSERLFQKIWMEGAFDQSRLTTLAGSRVEVLTLGTWNQLGGPDFKRARLRFDHGKAAVGDVELHLRAEDWDAHHHVRDPAYVNVKLHVVLFPPRPGHVTIGFDGLPIPILTLLPWLPYDLEEYAAEEAVATLADRATTRLTDLVRRMPSTNLEQWLNEFARKRWEQKVHFARLKIERVGWAEACHQTAMEVLGYRFNRVPMLRLAMQYPLGQWATVGDDELARRLAEEDDRWTKAGVRPANHPRVRLRQYRDWAVGAPDWPDRLAELGPTLPRPSIDAPTASVRKEYGLAALRNQLADRLANHAVGGTRWDTLISDGFWPLLASRVGIDLAGLWYHWYPGDLPETLVKVLRQTGRFRRPAAPACHGPVQGLIGWLVTQES